MLLVIHPHLISILCKSETDPDFVYSTFVLSYPLDDYTVAIFGPTSKVMVGETVVLDCTVGRKLPDLMIVTKDSSSMKFRDLDDILLKNGEWRKGVSLLLRQVGLSDVGNYTCEATWNESDYTRKDMYALNVTGKFCTLVRIYHLVV